MSSSPYKGPPSAPTAPLDSRPSFRARIGQAIRRPSTASQTDAPASSFSAPSTSGSSHLQPVQQLILLLRMGEVEAALKQIQDFPRAATERDPLTGLTPLHVASYGSNVEVVERLLAAGASPLARDQQGWTALHLACHSSSPVYLDIVEGLLHYTGAPPTPAVANALTNNFRTPLAFLCRNTCYTQLGEPGFIKFAQAFKDFVTAGADV